MQWKVPNPASFRSLLRLADADSKMETKIPQKGGFTHAVEKNFFAGTEASVPQIPNIPHKPHEVTPPQKIETPVNESLRTDVLLKSNISQKNHLGGFENKLAAGKPAKPFENVSGGLAPLRTYRQDVAGVMRDKKTSLVQMVLQEQKERNKREQEKSPSSRRNLPLIFLSLLFLFSSAGMVYYAYFRTNLVDRALLDLKIDPIIFVEKNKEISIDGKDGGIIKDELTKLFHGEDLKVDVLEYIFFTETLNTQTPGGMMSQKNLLPADRLFETLGLKMPPMLLRSLRPDFMLGFHSFNKNQPFLILKTDYYDNAFAGMLAWENKIAENLLPIFGRANRVNELSQRKWDDTVIKNKDTRVLRNFDGSIAIVYAFKDQRTLIITTSEDTLLEVSSRLDLTQEKRSE